MKGRKVMVFVVNEVVMVLVLVALFLFSPENIPILSQWVLMSMVANGAAYATGNVVSKAIVSKNYHEGLSNGNH